MPEYESRVQLSLPSPTQLFTPAITVIIVLIIAGFALKSHAEEFTRAYLALNPQTCFPGRLWQLVTFVFINGCSLNMVFNGVVVLFVGSTVEREWGTKSFVQLWLVVSVVCGLIWLLVNLIAGWNYLGIGTGSCAYGLIATFGLLFRRRRFWFYFCTVEAQHLALIFIGIGLVLGIALPISWIWVGGAGVAYVYIKLRWRIADRVAQNISMSGRKKRGGFVDVD